MKKIVFKRLIDKNEKAQIVYLFKGHYYNPDEITNDTLKKLSSKYKENAQVMIAEYNDEIIGYIAYYRNDYTCCIAYISNVVIKKEYRGLGIGEALLYYVVTDCKSSGFNSIRLEVDNNNIKALSLYKKLGFRKEQKASEHSSYYLIHL